MNNTEEKIKSLEENIKSLQEENDALKNKLFDYKNLDEELTAKRIFDIAYKRLVAYLTFGGVITILLGLLGYSTITNFLKQQAIAVTRKMNQKAITKTADSLLAIKVVDISNSEIKKIDKNLQDSANKSFKIICDKIAKLSFPKSGDIINNRNAQPTLLKTNPDFIDLSSNFGSINHEGDEGSVVGFVMADALAELVKIQSGKYIEFSARYIYNSINNQHDYGATIAAGLLFLKNTGGIEEQYWPYIPGQFATPIPVEAAKAPHYKIAYFEKIDISISKFKNYLAIKKPIIVGLTAYSAYMNVDNTGILPFYNSNFISAGGTAVNVVGYDDHKQLIKLRFSWGKNFGNNGYCYLHYADLNTVVSEAYIIG